MRSPPNPVRRTVGSRRLSSRIRFAPCRSPLGSPALMKTCIPTVSSFEFRVSSRPGNPKPATRNSALRRGRVPLDAGQIALGLHLAVAERDQDFEHLAPGRERPAVLPLIPLHRLHE